MTPNICNSKFYFCWRASRQQKVKFRSLGPHSRKRLLALVPGISHLNISRIHISQHRFWKRYFRWAFTVWGGSGVHSGLLSENNQSMWEPLEFSYGFITTNPQIIYCKASSQNFVFQGSIPRETLHCRSISCSSNFLEHIDVFSIRSHSGGAQQRTRKSRHSNQNQLEKRGLP